MDIQNDVSFINFFPNLLVIFIFNFLYDHQEQHMWSEEFKSCDGNLQSPIAISTTKSVILPLPALEMNGYHDFLFRPLSLKNNGHSVALNFEKKILKKRPPYIFGGLLNVDQEYELEGLHFHWGRKNDRGSEHSLNGVRHVMKYNWKK